MYYCVFVCNSLFGVILYRNVLLEVRKIKNRKGHHTYRRSVWRSSKAVRPPPHHHHHHHYHHIAVICRNANIASKPTATTSITHTCQVPRASSNARNVTKLYVFSTTATWLQFRGFVIMSVVGDRTWRRSAAHHRAARQDVHVEGLVSALAENRTRHEHDED